MRFLIIFVCVFIIDIQKTEGVDLLKLILAPRPRPSITGIWPFNATADAIKIHNAVKNAGTDEAVINEIVSTRNLDQRLDISITYESMFETWIIKRLKEDTSRHYEDLLTQMFTPYYGMLAKKLYESVKGMGTKDNQLIEILCAYDNRVKRLIFSAFELKYDKGVCGKVRGDTSGEYQEILVEVCMRQQPEEITLNPFAVKLLGDYLRNQDKDFSAGLKNMLKTYSRVDLNRVLVYYKRTYKESLTAKVDKKYSGKARTALKTILEVIEDPAMYWAKKIKESMHTWKGTEDKHLIYLITTHCDVDLQDIKAAFFATYNEHLQKFVGDALQEGDYKNLIVKIIEGNWEIGQVQVKLGAQVNNN